MERNTDFNNPYGYQQFTDNFENQYNNFNPMTQYEQGYMYYRYLTQQLEYKMKYKEFEKMCNENKDCRNERRVC